MPSLLGINWKRRHTPWVNGIGRWPCGVNGVMTWCWESSKAEAGSLSVIMVVKVGIYDSRDLTGLRFDNFSKVVKSVKSWVWSDWGQIGVRLGSDLTTFEKLSNLKLSNLKYQRACLARCSTCSKLICRTQNKSSIHKCCTNEQLHVLRRVLTT